MKDIAVIFDFDGVIVNSEPAWQKYECSLLMDVFEGFTEKDFHIVRGKSIDESYEMLEKRWKPKQSEEFYLESMMERIPRLYAETNLCEGVKDVLNEIHQRHIPIVLGSSSRRAWIEPVLSSYEISDFFQHLVTYDDVAHAKPAPDIFLKNAEKMKRMPEQCIVIEDSINGVLAAKAAGMRTIGYIAEEGRTIEPEPDVVIHHYDHFLEAFEKLCASR